MSVVHSGYRHAEDRPIRDPDCPSCKDELIRELKTRVLQVTAHNSKKSRQLAEARQWLRKAADLLEKNPPEKMNPGLQRELVAILVRTAQRCDDRYRTKRK